MIYAIVFAAIPNFFSGFFFSFGITNMQVPVIFIQMFGATLTIGAYVFLGGTLLITIVEAYLVSVFGLIMSGLSPLRTTHAYGTQKVIGYAISVGVKLLTLYLVIGLIQTVIAPIIAAAAAIPIAGALTVGFYGIILALIAYNVPTFASTIVSGIASGNASAGVSAMTAAAGSATAMAQSMHGISEGIHNRNEAKQMGSDVQDRQTGSKQATGTTADQHAGTKQSVSTDLSKETLPSAGQNGGSPQGVNSKAVSSSPSIPQNVTATSNSPGGTTSGVQSADSSNGAKPAATEHHGVRGFLDKAGSEAKQLGSEMKSGEQGSAAAGSASAGQGNGSTQNGGQSDSKQTKSAYEKFKEVNDDPNATTDQKNAAANTFWSAQSKELSDAKQEMMSSFDGLGKGFAGMLTPSGGASSGAVAGATLKSSV